MEHSTILLALFLAFVSAILLGALAEKLKLPAVVGQIVAGIVIGPSALRWIQGDSTTFLHSIGELGATFLLFAVGLETPLDKLKEVGKEALLVAVLGVIFPFAAGFAYAYFTGHSNPESAFVAATFVATSAGITAKVLQDLGVIDRKFAQVILGAAIIDDVLAMLILTVVTSVATGDGVSPLELVWVLVQSLGFVLVTAFLGRRIVRNRVQILGKAKSLLSPWTLSIALCMGMAVLATKFGLATIIGAFLIGMLLAETSYREWLHEKVIDLNAFIVPIFFVSAGLNIDLNALSSPAAIGTLLLVSALAFLSKYIGAWLGCKDDRSMVGVGMAPRGEVGIIVAGLGVQFAVISKSLYSILVGMSILTSILGAMILWWLIKRNGSDEQT